VIKTSRPLTQEQFWRYAICRATVVHSRHVGPRVAMLEAQGYVIEGPLPAPVACSNQLRCDGIALQEASTKAAHEVIDPVIAGVI
jgi:hypothetical protein